MKNIQVLKESEKNAEILAQLDQFIADYQSKMSAITALTPSVSGSKPSLSVVGTSKKELDLIEYNANKDAYDAALSAGNRTEMARLKSRNDELRKLYGVGKDTGEKLQTFSEGGRVRGERVGDPKIIEAHVGEAVLNNRQEDDLINFINFKLPQLNFSMPSFSMPSIPSGSGTGSNFRSDVAVNMGDIYIADDSTAKVFWTEKDNFVRRVQSRTGAK